MGSSPWTTGHDEMLAQAAPPVAEASESDVARVWNHVERPGATPQQVMVTTTD
jgi:hypothetical protein